MGGGGLCPVAIYLFIFINSLQRRFRKILALVKVENGARKYFEQKIVGENGFYLSDSHANLLEIHAAHVLRYF